MELFATEAILFHQLMALVNWDESVQALTDVDGSEAFYFQDFPVDDDENTVLRIFNYRMAGYELFRLPGALECRGIMFEVDPLHDAPLRLVARPMQKFFNYRENPFTIYDADFALVDAIEFTTDKEDGSLISSYRCPRTGDIKLKSRGSIKSEQCLAAMDYLYESPGLYDDIMRLDQAGYTVNMEWCSPIHRIVLPYEIGHLQVLNVRHRTTGEYLDFDMDIRTEYFDLRCYLVDETYLLPSEMTMYLCDNKVADFDQAFEELRAMTGIEGYVFKLKADMVPEGKAQWFKGKTDWYCSLHHSKDSITNPRRLFECVMDDGTDDLRQMFRSDPLALQMIEDAEAKYHPLFNNWIAGIEKFYNDNQDLERKEYAIKGKAELGNDLGRFGLAMTLYGGGEVNWKGFFKKQWRKLGLKDEKVEVDE